MDGSRQDQWVREEEAHRRMGMGRVYQKRENLKVGMRVTDGCDMGPHPQDVIDHAGTPWGDQLLMMQLNVNVGIAIAAMYEEINKSWWQRILDWIMRR